MFLVYRATSIPDAARTTDTWRRELVRLGVGDPYLCLVHSFDADRVDPRSLGFDAAVKFAPDWRILRRQLNGSLARRGSRRVLRPRSPYRINTLRDYSSVVSRFAPRARPRLPALPVCVPGVRQHPETTYGRDCALEFVSRRLRDVAPGDRCALRALRSRRRTSSSSTRGTSGREGNHLEPCQRWGRAYLEAHARVVADLRSAIRARTPTAADPRHGLVGVVTSN